jgi:hypothetical protein
MRRRVDHPLPATEPFTSGEEAFIAGQEKHIKAFGDLLDTAHLEARTSRLLKEAESLKARLMEVRSGEAADCIEMACCAIEDARTAL